ncbi:hypothetical protein CVE34_05935 [Pseudomonas syringae pv. actinidiae]|uniref:Uncharacterized protein n=2 Tax=Pseudomonas syringae group TaxID=136849 RepID=A0A261WC16_9PSED|nr:hypothetical protein JN853_17780 [Pseudomonas syringae pv. actinidiae ICMP 9853]ATV18549.1 hypothetical protein CT122_18235 [Pseudomonas syringae pv. actinidiae]AYL81870.1 hypothetical protein CN228_19860 [Pseudomonas syringae pv. actinidiae str. Shaanxi_M228]OZI83463.1 hypothetical protein CFN58_31190 [Pseudomonas avellanae]AYL16170.1 hypothetical protein D9N00_17785 [Pseudomonas syringae pv. actinidiae]
MKYRLREQARSHGGQALACGSELAHEESGANAEYLLISQSVFASKLALTQATHSRVDHAIKTLETRLTKQSFIF